MGVEPEGMGRSCDLGTRIDTNDPASEINQLERWGAIPATQIENSLTRLRRQQVNDGHAEIGDKPGILPVLLWVPVLGL